MRELKRRIVVGVDATPTSRLALEEAVTIARAHGSEVVAVFVRWPPYSGWSLVVAGAAVLETLDDLQIVAEADSAAVLGSAGIPWSFEVRSGEPAVQLVRAAEECDAETIVVAGRRHNALGCIFRGAVAAQLLHRWHG
jgi:nucleotide-binding universal stress UspA family protein